MTQRTGTTGSIRRVAATGSALLTATVLLTGCAVPDRSSAGATPPAPSTSPSPDPKTALLAAVPDDDDPRFRFTHSGGADKVSGVVDPAAEATELTFSQRSTDPAFTMTMSMRVIDDRVWMRVKLTGIDGLHEAMKLPKRWMKLDPSKIKDEADNLVYEGADPGNTGVLIESASTVQDKGSGTYTGFIDLTASDQAAQAVDDVDVAALGPAARQVPFTAVVGADGNLGSLTLKVPAAGKAKAHTVVTRYYDFGKAPSLAAPSGDQVQTAPASAYELLNG
ncbi:hypothetical protein [Micromonospora rifamycinica]|uniref:Uncharacterized protein n=1 Tax=Micromonospora rifamycinica TaxID=291594 RepID=A0A109IIX4_9ACTN|nr:hypothetical protein [Micromonospora rifamycinica]KWV31409.1 hypothetical protein AWV63_17830 [Micromonospora rifamycinica]SCG78422.1 hypothetical protein GA0070623_4398 [Micromonospora rifamycinica]